MKKMMNQAQTRKTNRLSLNRETIKVLEDPALLELARGGGSTTFTQPTQQQESTSQQSLLC